MKLTRLRTLTTAIHNIHINTKVVLVCLLNLPHVYANDVNILSADIVHVNEDRWQVEVTLKHAYTGWDHYANNWRVVDSQGNVLGTRVLYHPHVDEQPFTRGLSNLVIPPTVNTVYIEAHDKLHGWSGHRLKIELKRPDSNSTVSVRKKPQ